VSINEIAEPLAGSYKPRATQHLNPLKDRAIGTEFYRPPCKAMSTDEKLDVFSLGVIAFELLWKFETSKPSPMTRAYVNLALLTSDRNGTSHCSSGSE
jgi:translation initiation factor 2-alpha kinase 3